MEHEPCPNRVITDMGGAFAMGAVGGSGLSLFKGYVNGPRGHKWSSALATVARKAPGYGGRLYHPSFIFSSPCARRCKLLWVGSTSPLPDPFLGAFGVWCFCFSCFDCSFSSLRRVDDAWNAIAAGGATGGLLALRHGRNTVLRHAALGAIFLGLLEGVAHYLPLMLPRADPSEVTAMMQPAPAPDAGQINPFNPYGAPKM